MKHKKFVKQCMSLGAERNAAREFAGAVRQIGQPYDRALAEITILWRIIQASQEEGRIIAWPAPGTNLWADIMADSLVAGGADA